ncbi:MAG: MGMT family protein [Mycetocola sp.]
MNEDFVDAVHSVVDDIPTGRVLAYGQVAARFGSRSSRGVGRVMAHYGDGLPWWRVVRADGRVPAERADEAAARYTEEGTPFRRTEHGLTVLRSAFWDGHDSTVTESSS